jgi:predicted flap endonuclease-1-like 5' DNA nuclease
MSQTTIIIVAVIVVLVILLFLLLRSRRQHVRFGDQPAELPPMAPPASKAPISTVKPVPAVASEGQDVGAEVSAAIEDVLDQFIGIDAHPSGQDQVKHAGDTLTTMKGLGPKAATLLNDLGVTTFAQIAAWDDGDVDAIDAQLGVFKGRIRRDRWVEQAKFLAKNDTAGFEEAFGKIS